MLSDKKIIDAVSVALDGKIGQEDDVARLREQIENGGSENKINTACEISVAFIRLTQDLKAEIKILKSNLCREM